MREPDVLLDLCPSPGCTHVLYDDGVSLRCPMCGPMFVSPEAERWGFKPEGDRPTGVIEDEVENMVGMTEIREAATRKLEDDLWNEIISGTREGPV